MTTVLRTPPVRLPSFVSPFVNRLPFTKPLYHSAKLSAPSRRRLFAAFSPRAMASSASPSSSQVTIIPRIWISYRFFFFPDQSCSEVSLPIDLRSIFTSDGGARWCDGDFGCLREDSCSSGVYFQLIIWMIILCFMCLGKFNMVSMRMIILTCKKLLLNFLSKFIGAWSVILSVQLLKMLVAWEHYQGLKRTKIEKQA